MMLGFSLTFFYTDPPHIVDFGKVHEEGNAFSVNVTVHVLRRDEFVLQVVHNQSNTYLLEGLKLANMLLEFMSRRFMKL